MIKSIERIVCGALLPAFLSCGDDAGETGPAGGRVLVTFTATAGDTAVSYTHLDVYKRQVQYPDRLGGDRHQGEGGVEYGNEKESFSFLCPGKMCIRDRLWTDLAASH